MKKIVLVFFIISLKSWGQENLAPNSSFEELSACPTGNADILLAYPWIGGSVDYYHECGTNGYGIPVNKVGGGEAHSGEAYIGLYLRIFNIPNHREFARAQLTTALIPAKRYNVEIYVSLADSMWYATKSIGAYFSVGDPSSNTDILLSYEPQVKYTGDEFLTNKESWTKIEGSFIADGGENFITIGNFDSNGDTDTMFVSGGGVFRPNQPDYWRSAYYFIDDISVTVDTTTGINELEQVKFDIYPNPNDGSMYVEYRNLTDEARFELYDVTGRKVATYNLTTENGILNISERELSNGVYLFRITNDKHKFKFGKVIISR